MRVFNKHVNNLNSTQVEQKQGKNIEVAILLNTRAYKNHLKV